jgi:hypothetical protein
MKAAAVSFAIILPTPNSHLKSISHEFHIKSINIIWVGLLVFARRKLSEKVLKKLAIGHRESSDLFRRGRYCLPDQPAVLPVIAGIALLGT